MLSTQFWSAIYNLYELLVENCNEEANYQDYFEKNESPFRVLGLKEPKSFEKKSEYQLPYDPELEYTPEPDFIALKTNSSTLVIVELKTPFVGKITTSRKDDKRLKLSAQSETYISQCTEYAQSITGRIEAREYLQKIYNIDIISDVEIILIYALSKDNSDFKSEKLTANRKIPTKIIHFDSLLSVMKDEYVRQTNIPINQGGITAVYHITFHKNQINGHAVISEGKSKNGDRLLFEYSDGVIFFKIYDKQGKNKTLQANVQINQITFVRFEFCSNNIDSTFICLTVNNAAQDLQISNMPMSFNYENDAFSIGASLDGTCGGCFSLHEHYQTSKILNINDRLGSFHYFKRKRNVPGKVVFFGKEYLYRNDKNNMIQPISHLQPKYDNNAQQNISADLATARVR